MSIMAEVRKRIDRMYEGSLITYKAFGDLSKSSTVALALSRLCEQGVIRRLQKGKYYRIKKTKFGELDPSDEEILKNLVGKDSYISGVSAYNRLGLTTQVPNEITIKGRKYSRRTKIGKLQIRYVSNTAEVRPGTSGLLQLLDALKNIKTIPDSDIKKSFEKLSEYIQNLSNDERKRLAKLALVYKPAVRAMVGAVLDQIDETLTQKLKASLNPLTSYKIGLAESQMANLNEWRIQ
jgi:predicted transcriptional regulator of viral defense system